LKYRELHHQAKHIDRLIDANMPVGGSLFLSPEELEKIISKNYPDFYFESSGWHKVVFGSSAIDHKVVLKVGPKKSIELDHRAYTRVPERVRHQFFARIFWHTKYCLLQEYGIKAAVTKEQLTCVRQAIYKYGIFDVKADNLRWVDGELKVIDANVTRIPLPTALRKIDEIKPKLPKKLNSIIKKITKRFYEK
jgi:hypothetical protein